MAETADIEDVLAANVSFYDAFERRSLESMGQVWEHSERVVCTHPGWPILRGWPLVDGVLAAHLRRTGPQPVHRHQ